jgi:hypothetical protein
MAERARGIEYSLRNRKPLNRLVSLPIESHRLEPILMKAESQAKLSSLDERVCSDARNFG